jgi:hypothetical protein
MKPSLHIIILSALSAVLCGCPYESPYAIDEAPQQNIDENLLGKWAAFVPKPSDDKHYREDPVKIIFSKRTDMEYDFAITGYINELKPYKVILNDSIKGVAFISTIGKNQFLNATIYGKVYIAALKQDANGLSIFSLSEHFTAKYIKSSKALKEAIEFHYRTRPIPIYDDWFVLKNLQKVN